MDPTIHESVRRYYGEMLTTNKDLKTDACCLPEELSGRVRAIMAQIHPDVLDKFYGCGSPIPPALEGQTVLDLGFGSGRDVFVLSKLVGAAGRVIGVDMTEAQLAVGRGTLAYHAEAFGYREPNVELLEGYIEDLASLGIADASIDLVVSNCVLNLSPRKDRVFSEIFRVLKPGGELYFSDVFGDRRIPARLASDPLLVGECLGGALYIEDFRRLMRSVGCLDYRVTQRNPLTLRNDEVIRAIGMVRFQSMTIRSFKLDFEDICEDYGHVATYRGTIDEAPHHFDLDDHHRFETGRPLRVCGNTARMLSETRFAPHFTVQGSFETHFGAFDCASDTQTSPAGSGDGACC
ncbi:MAG: methyltransferase domain-containing protein [Myxococcales bacterium]|nr:methyltransferase domain-containing protein [Myxococcales bacterium]